MNDSEFSIDVAREIWETKYRRAGERDVRDTWRRVAAALAAVEPTDADGWSARFFALLEDFRFLPGGRILAGAGTGRRVTLFNCFVMGAIEDSMDGIFDALKEGALTMQQGGGVGYDFSTLRPRGIGGARRRRHRVRTGVVHAHLGQHVRHAAVHRRAARRHDGDPALRSPRHRGVHRRQARSGAVAPFQPLGAGHRCVHRRRGGRHGLAAGVSAGPRGAGATEGAIVERSWPGRPEPGACESASRVVRGARAVGTAHARDLRLRRAGRAVHRPHQPRKQSALPRDASARPIPAAKFRCRPTAPATWGRSI